MEFVAIDLETANEDYSSICQIGVCHFLGHNLHSTYSSLVNPNDYFSPINVAIHGIEKQKVSDAPTFPQVYAELTQWLTGRIVVCHTHFDRLALIRAAEKHELPQIECTWLDSAKVVRRTWDELSKKGYGLKNVTKTLGIEFRHHDALEDARACGEVLLRAIDESGVALEDWPRRCAQSNRTSYPEQIRMEGNEDGPLFGEVIVFTGSLSLSRKEAATMAAQAGCYVSPSVTKKTTVLVVGDQDLRFLNGQQKSSKHRKAEELVSKGQELRILQESDFKRLIDL